MLACFSNPMVFLNRSRFILFHRYGACPNTQRIAAIHARLGKRNHLRPTSVFILGACAGVLLRDFVKVARPIPLMASWAGWIIGISIYFIAAFVLRDHVTWRQGLLGQVVFGLCSLGLIVGCLGRSPISQLLEKKPFVYIGYNSYSFYLCHGFVILRFERMNVDAPVIAKCLISLILASLIYELVEKPSRKFITNRWARRD